MSGQLLQNGKQSFIDVNGHPLTGGQVFFYNPGTQVLRDTWRDAAMTVLNTNPVILDARGEASIYGVGAYRQVVRDAAGVLIWDQVLPNPLDNDGTNVAYVYPDGIARPISTLATKNDPLLGSAGIAHENGTVRDALLTLDADLETSNLVVSKLFSSPIDAVTLPLHFGPLRGRGWTAGDPPQTPEDPGNVKSTTATAAVGKTGTDIPVASADRFAAGMMICYLAVDGEYYSAKLHAILPGPAFRLGETLPEEIANGAPIYNFYRDDAHPNAMGGAAIVDDALRRMRDYRIRELEYRSRSGATWGPLLNATLTQLTTADYGNPGGIIDGDRGVSVASTTVDAGVASGWVSLTGGDYVAVLPVNVGLRTGGFSGFVSIYVDEITSDGVTQTIASSGGLNGYDCIRLVELEFSCRPGSNIRVRVTSGNSGGWSFSVGMLSYYHLGPLAASINRGKVCLFGDSWLSPGSGMAARFTARLDKADVSVKGVGGDTAQLLIARFYTDVAPLNPDVVIVCDSTNDYYQSVAPGLYEQQMLQIRRMIQSIGALPVFFDVTVGAITFSPEKLSPSRTMQLRTRYEQISPEPDGAGVIQRTANFQAVSLAVSAGATVVVGVVPGKTRGPAVLRSIYMNQSSLEVIVDFPSVVDGAGSVDPMTLSGAAQFNDRVVPRLTDLSPRFVALKLRNPTTGVVNVTLSADLCWYQAV